MGLVPVDESHLNRELGDFGEKYPKLEDHEIFVAWFLRAYITEAEEVAVTALTGASNDKGIDAILTDDAAEIVFIVQGKYRKGIAAKNETRNDVVSFAQLAAILTSPDRKAFNGFASELDDDLRGRLKQARERVLKRKYALCLYYVTTGRCSQKLQEEASSIVRRESAIDSAKLDIIGGRQILLLLSDYLDGVAPPIPSLELHMESGSSVQVNGTHQRFDRKTKIESWVFSMKGDDVADLFEKTGTRLFARNVRGFLGSTAINKGMQQTLASEPEFFWYYNNGVTIVCDGAEKVSKRGRDLLLVSNPQVINGQQTTRTLQLQETGSGSASVLVKVIHVPREPGSGSGEFDNLVSRIVASTNWQNAIRPSDLMANDRKQVELERQLRKLDYQYSRKRETKAEARKRAVSRHRFLLKKDEVAQAVAACELDPLVVRSGKERLFGEDLYPVVFPNTDPYYYLSRYWLMRRTALEAKGFPERAYAKWVVLGFVWRHLQPLLRGRRKADRFRVGCEKRSALLVPLGKAISTAFRGALGFYRIKRGRGASATDISTFFKRKELDRQFAAFWADSPQYSRPFANHLRRFETALNSE